ncbi:hypothetical protein BH11PLA2_BH11PLA2_01930 [soil metagenome]
MAALKCPNPSCPFLFDPTQVPAGAILTCPRCTMRFTLGTPSETAPAANLDFSAKSVPARTATPDGAAKTPTQTVEEPPPSFLQSRSLMVVGIGACALVVCFLGYLLFSGDANTATSAPGERRYPDINMAITVPEGWESDPDAKTLVKANVLAVKKVQSSARVAMASTNYLTRNAPAGELKDGIVVERLDALFDDVEVTPSEAPWLGQKAMKFTFRGRGKGVEGNFAGEAYALGYQGYAYWFLAWSLEADYGKVAAEIEEIRSSARFLQDDSSWKPTETGFAVINGEGYSLTDGDKWWEKQADPVGEDPKAELVLTAKFKAKVKVDQPPKAWAVIYRLDGSDDPVGRLRGYVKPRYEKLYGIKKWNDITGAAQGDSPAAGDTAGSKVASYHAEQTDDPRVSKFVVLNAIALPDGKVIGIEMSCPWKDRGVWEKRLMQLAGSLKAK